MGTTGLSASEPSVHQATGMSMNRMLRHGDESDGNHDNHDDYNCDPETDDGGHTHGRKPMPACSQ